MSIDVPHDPHPPASPPPPNEPPTLAEHVKAALAEKRLTLATWAKLRSPEGVPIAAHPKAVVHAIGSFTRGGIDALKYSKHFGAKELASLLEERRRKGTELFESPEHEGLTDNIVLRISPTSSWGNMQGFTLSGGAEVTYADTIALAGDFFGQPGTPISDGNGLAQQQANFRASFNTLDTASPSYVQAILNLINQQAAQVAGLAAGSTASDRYSQAYTEANSGKYWDAWYNGATGGANPYDVTNLQNYTGPLEGLYTRLAGTNWDHFGQHAVNAYTAGHSVALQQAQTAWQNKDQNALLRAYILDAFACHFLSDLFATGHLRTPRKALHATISPFPDLLAQIMHDEDNYNGMMVKSNIHPEGWLAYGDKRMEDTANATNASYAGDALQASADEIYAVWTSGVTPVSTTSYAALNYIPNLSDAWNRNNTNNWRPLFVVPNASDESSGNLDNTQIRVSPFDLRGNDWITMDDWYVPPGYPIYAGYWEALPGGGVHSVEGAPPSVVASWAHNFQWSQYGRFDHGMTSKLTNISGVAAAIQETPPPAINDNDPNVNDLPQTGKTDILYVFYKGSGTQINYLTTPMSNVPGFTAPCTLVTGQSQWQTNGIPAVLNYNGSIQMVFPDTSGQIVLASQLANGVSWSSPPIFLFGSQKATYKMRTSGTPALAQWGTTLYLAYRDGNNGLHLAVGNGATGTWGTPSAIAINGKTVTADSNPSITVTGGYLVLTVGGSSSSDGNQVTVYRTPLDTNGQPGTWTKYLNGLKDSANDALLVKSFAQVFAYADAYAIVGTSPNASNIRTIVPVQDSNPTGSWNMAKVTVGGSNAQTGTRVAVLFYQGNPYLVYADSNASGTLAAITSAVTPLHTIPGGTQ